MSGEKRELGEAVERLKKKLAAAKSDHESAQNALQVIHFHVLLA